VHLQVAGNERIAAEGFKGKLRISYYVCSRGAQDYVFQLQYDIPSILIALLPTTFLLLCHKHPGALPLPPNKPIRYYKRYFLTPGLLVAQLRLQEREAEVIMHLLADDEQLYDGDSYWEHEEGEMRRVPW
jgi:hypothetical protein